MPCQENKGATAAEISSSAIRGHGETLREVSLVSVHFDPKASSWQIYGRRLRQKKELPLSNRPGGADFVERTRP